jgi:hypothetical protein
VLDRNAVIPPDKWCWHLEDLRALVRREAITLHHDAVLVRVESDHAVVNVAGDDRRIANDAVIVMTGYRPDAPLLERLGIAYDAATLAPAFDPLTFESNVRGVYLVGIVCAGTSPDKVFVWGARHHPKAIVHHILEGSPLPVVRDLGVDGTEHWKQFERMPIELDEELALRLVPVATGELGDDAFDLYFHSLGGENPYFAAPKAEAAIAASGAGPLLGALDGWLFKRNDDGSAEYKGQRFSESALEILKLCDGTRRMSDIAAELAAEYEQPEAELRALVLRFVLPLLRAGKLSWRPA